MGFTVVRTVFVCFFLGFPWLIFTGVGFANPINDLPSLGDAGSTALSIQDERRLGELIMKDYRAFGAYSSDPEITTYLNRLGDRLVQAAGESPSNFKFFLVSEPSINAFALPGGFIGVHAGLMAASQNEGELAAVLAHEVAHVTQRHIARMYGRQQQANLVSTAAVIAALLVASNSPQAAQGLAAAGAGYQLDSRLSFSRDAEREADRVGLNTLVKSGFSPQDMVAFFGRLLQSSRFYENTAPTYLRTHPLTTERIADVAGRAAQAAEGNNDVGPGTTTIEFELMRMRALVLPDQSSEQLRERLAALKAEGALKQLRFSEPVALLYGQSLVLDRMGQRKPAFEAINQAIELEQKGRSLVKVRPSPLLLQAQQVKLMIDQRAALNNAPDAVATLGARDDLNKNDKAFLAKLDRYLDEYRGVYSVKLQYALALQAMGLFSESETFLRDLLLVYRSRPEVYDSLAKASLVQGKQAQYHLFLAKGHESRGAFLPAIEQTQLAKRMAAGNYHLTAEIDAVERTLKQKADAERKLTEAFQ